MNNKKFRTFWLIVIVIVLAAAAIACGGGDGTIVDEGAPPDNAGEIQEKCYDVSGGETSCGFTGQLIRLFTGDENFYLHDNDPQTKPYHQP